MWFSPVVVVAAAASAATNVSTARMGVAFGSCPRMQMVFPGPVLVRGKTTKKQNKNGANQDRVRSESVVIVAEQETVVSLPPPFSIIIIVVVAVNNQNLPRHLDPSTSFGRGSDAFSIEKQFASFGSLFFLSRAGLAQKPQLLLRSNQ